MVYFDQMSVKYNLLMTLAKLTNMCKDLNLDQGDVYKSKYYLADHFCPLNLAYNTESGENTKSYLSRPLG